MRHGRIAAVLAVLLATVSGATAVAQQGAAPPAVIVTTVEIRNVAPVYEFVGRVEATDAVDLRTRVDGFLEAIQFLEGQDVTVGQPLIKIEDGRYRALVKAARGTVAQAQAVLDRARLEVARVAKLAAQGNVAQARLDDAKTDAASAEAALLVAQAELDTRLIDLQDTEIKSPIAGRIGRSEVTVGNLIGQSTGRLARVVALDPIRVVFSVSEDRFVATRKLLGAQLSSEEINSLFTPRVRLADGAMYDEVGVIDFVDNEVDPTTGTIAVRALFLNPRQLLLPGQFVSVIVTRGNEDPKPVVPHRAVQQDRDGRFVLIVDEADTVVERRVVLGANTGDGWGVMEGLGGGERVVVDGFQKAAPGTKVAPMFQADRAGG